MENNLEEKANQSVNRFQWFIYVVAIPTLFALVVALIVLTFAGINVIEKGKEMGSKIPILSNFMNENPVQSIEDFEEKTIQLEAEIKDREARMDQLQSKIDNKDKEVKRLQLEKEQLEAQIDELTAMQEENKRAFKDIVKTYESMSAKNAAAIISEMNNEEAMKILSNITSDSLAGIMEKLPAEDAARFTEMLTNESGLAMP